MMMSSKDVEYYMSLPYKIELTPEEDGGFSASIPDLKGCVAFGETVAEAYQIITEVKQNWIEIALEQGWQIPEPFPEQIKEYSGRFVVRIPRYLHRELAQMAQMEGTTLNQLSVAFLSEGAERQRQKHLLTRYESYVGQLATYFLDAFDAGGQATPLQPSVTTISTTLRRQQEHILSVSMKPQ
jgi:antitoxin HicB